MFGLWPSSKFPNFHGEMVRRDRLTFLFLFCPNNSGTTIMCQYLASQLDAYLPPFGNNEGQMAPDLTDMMRAAPWDENVPFDWPFIRKTWEGYAQGRLFVEGSPPNLIRVPQIAETFGKDSSAVVSICNPYQYVASCLRRYHHRPELARPVAEAWLVKARHIRQITLEYPQFAFVPYEIFVADPTELNRRLGLPVRNARLEGKAGSGGAHIRSAYARSVGFLTAQDMERIDAVLTLEPELLASFGYAVDRIAALDRARADDPKDFEFGQRLRAEWDRQRL